MECHSIRSSELPHTTRLYADYLEDFPRLKTFYGHPPTLEGAAAAAKQLSLSPEVRAGVVAALREQNQRFGAGAATFHNLERLARGAAAVVTGQQVGLFTGPAFSFYKALTAVAIARKLTEAGTDAVPVFWLATEDHDLAEVNHSFWLGPDGIATRVELAVVEAAGHRVGEIALGRGIEAARKAVSEKLQGPESGTIERLLAETYTPSETFGSAFAKLMARLLAERGIILLDPLDSRLHRLAAPLFQRALDEHAALAKDLIARGKALDRAGYHTQVKITPQSTQLFFNVDGERRPLRARNGELYADRGRVADSELRAALAEAPERFSANVLLRPVMQDFLLPTVAYVGGPAEVAYFAQAEVLYSRLLGRMPAILPRVGFTLVERHVARLLKKYGLEVRDVWRGRQALRTRLERQSLPAGLTEQFDTGEKAIRGILTRLRRPLEKLDRTLGGALETAEQKILYQFLKLRGKAGRAENFRTGVLERHEQTLVDALYPHHGPQERAVCLLSFLAGHGLELLDEMESHAAEGAAKHHVLYL